MSPSKTIVAGPKCAICGKPQEAGYRPFCSRRCADEDLRRWLSGSYVVPGRPDDDEDGASSTQDKGGGEDGE